jgi:hypothetical protein
MANAKEHSGGCHCGKVRYTVTTDMAQVMSCNCSICQKRGHWLTFVPEDQFELLSGEDDLTDYQFYKRKIHHLFCKTCGIESFARGSMPDGRKMIAVNVRCLDDVDLSALTPKEVNGRSF